MLRFLDWRPTPPGWHSCCMKSKRVPLQGGTYDKRKPDPGGITVIYYRKEDRYEIYGGPDGKVSRRELTRLMVRWLNIPEHELALAYTEWHFRPETTRAEFGIDGHFLFVA